MHHAYLVAEKELTIKKPKLDMKGGYQQLAGYASEDLENYKDMDLDELEIEVTKRRRKARNMMDKHPKNAFMKDVCKRRLLITKPKP
jgi:reverse gyrase